MATSVTRDVGAASANVTKYLKGADFPAKKQDLLKQAKQLKAEQVIIDEIQKLEDRDYTSVADVMKSFGQESRPFSQRGQRPVPERGRQTKQGKAQQKPSHQR